ncbi:MAG: helix-turn-helix transcriptional regulator [Clostridia bacterium]|nr:helix-turn-helix transcriptional regulator [Clostridia bacterium]
MPRKSLGVMTESMFYTIMAFQAGPRCGTEISALIEELTGGRVQLGPGTLYTILSKFLEVGYLCEMSVEGRKRTYRLTEEGRQAYRTELARLNQCILDASAVATFALREGDAPDESENFAMAPAPMPGL